ncbi:MAG: 2-amino-4-hydroxy-6-hydroxymethyldihydropteridine pyrophosphokinase [Firmicutes bacterium HGW-Firmicutes-7]|nr:MAG: 2-amino-4-hydroxy-6-hydroxymethyldihydropteridine pyrophosphokinase [Firmicutes bacterium HGW-Firmicutes-7]
MDKIIIKDLEIYAFHGVHQSEKDLGQRFLISVELKIDLLEAGQTDKLTTTVNYAQLCLELEQVFKREKHDLIERAAEQLCDHILMTYERVQEVRLTIKKPWAPIGKMLDYAAVEIERGWHTAYIALGSNLGDKHKYLQQAIDKIRSSVKNKVTKISDFYETDPVGYVDQDKFINGAIEIKTLYTPKELIRYLLDIEQQLERIRTIPGGPRTIDLDVLLYDQLITSFEEIIIPHPRMHEREFVLKPLNDIAPFVVHPMINERIGQLLNKLGKM